MRNYAMKYASGIMMMALLLGARGVGAQDLNGNSGGYEKSELLRAIEALPALRSAQTEQDNYDYAPLRLQEPKEVGFDTLVIEGGRKLIRLTEWARGEGAWSACKTDGRPILACSEQWTSPARLQFGALFFGGWMKLSLHEMHGVDKNKYWEQTPIHKVKVHKKLYSTILYVGFVGGYTENASVYCYHNFEEGGTWEDKLQNPVACFDDANTHQWRTKTSAGERIVVETHRFNSWAPGWGENVSISDIDGTIAKENVSSFLPSTLNVSYVEGLSTIGDMFHQAGTGPEDQLLRYYGLIPVEQYTRGFSGLLESSPISMLNYSTGLDLSISGHGRFYTGTKVIHLNFTNIPLRNEWIRDLPVSVAYNGSAQTPTFSVVNNGAALAKDVDYTVEYSNNTNVGTGWVAITGIGRYIGTATGTFQITPLQMESRYITGITDQTYTGNPLTPAPVVNTGSRTLVEGTDYSLAYLHNTNAGSGTLRVTGLGNYGGSVDCSFIIQPKRLPPLPSSAQQTYTGNPFTPPITLTDNDRTLAEGTDYTVAYSNNINVGTATISATGKGNYTGTQTATFTIAPKLMTNGVIIQVAQPAQRIYTGEAQALDVLTLTDKSVTLAEGRDYTVAYENNVNVGWAAVSITGKGNYTGTLSTAFEITRRTLSGCTLEIGSGDYVYSGTAIVPAVRVSDGARTLSEGTDYTLGMAYNVEAGHASVTVTGVGNYVDKLYGSFVILPRMLSEGSVQLSGGSEFTYNGQAFRPAFTVMDGERTLTASVDYTYEYANNIQPGTATLTVTGMGNYSGTQTVTFTIREREIESDWLRMTEESFTATGAPLCPTFVVVDYDNQRTLKPSADYTVTYSNNVTPGTATMVIAGTGAYRGTILREYTILAPAPSPYNVDSVEKAPEPEPEPEPGVLDIASDAIGVTVSGSMDNAIISVKNVDGTEYAEGVDWEVTWIIPGTPVLLQLTGKNALTGERYVWTRWISNGGVGTDAEAMATMSVSTIRGVSQGNALVLEGLQAGQAFTLYTIEGRKVVSGIAPVSGTYTLSAASAGLYILEHGGQRARVYHRGGR